MDIQIYIYIHVYRGKTKTTCVYHWFVRRRSQVLISKSSGMLAGSAPPLVASRRLVITREGNSGDVKYHDRSWIFYGQWWFITDFLWKMVTYHYD